VIIPVCNAEKYIAEAIDSVLAQTCPNLECIIIDDGSNDRTAEIVRGYGGMVRYIHQTNAERSAARNNGIAHASGKYLSFLDADDLLLPGKLSEQLAFLETHPEYDVVYSRVKYFKENGKRNYYRVRRITPSGDILPFLINANFITINSPLIKRAAVERVGGFDVTFSRYEDWDFLLRLALTGSRFGFMDANHVLCRMHGGNTVKDGPRMFEAKLSVVRGIVNRFVNELRTGGIEGNNVVAFHQADYGRKLILADRVAEGRKLIDEACKIKFPHRRKFKIFSLAAGFCGSRILALLHKYADSLCKYRKTSG
jgi:glycosyltransferase involved in cell wall biosynthesis